jgi:hypothetical protein
VGVTVRYRFIGIDLALLLEVIYSCSRGRAKLTYRVSDPILDSLLPGEIDISRIQAVPQLGREINMVAKNLLGTLVIEHKGFGNIVQSSGGSELRAVGALMHHEGGALSGQSPFRPQISDDTSRADLTRVIQRNFNGYGTEEVVKEHSVSDITPSRLEECMNMLNVVS